MNTPQNEIASWINALAPGDGAERERGRQAPFRERDRLTGAARDVVHAPARAMPRRRGQRHRPETDGVAWFRV